MIRKKPSRKKPSCHCPSKITQLANCRVSNLKPCHNYFANKVLDQQCFVLHLLNDH